MSHIDCKLDSDSRAAILKSVYLENQRMITRTAVNGQREGHPFDFSFLKIGKVASVLVFLSVLSIELFSKNLSPENYEAPVIYEIKQAPIHSMVAPESSNNFDLLLVGDKNIELSSLFGLGVKTVVIDPGHGGRDPGAVGAEGTLEKDITLDVSIKLKARLDEFAQFKVLLTRNKDITVTLADRVAFAKKNNADLFVSIHVNALPNKSLNAIETYYFGAPRSPETLRLAQVENSGSDFSMAELDLILADFENTLKRQESAKLAKLIQESLFKNIKRRDTKALNFGIRMAPFVVISQTGVPSVLVEISCISKLEQEARLATADYRSDVAGYITDGITAYLKMQNTIISDRRIEQ